MYFLFIKKDLTHYRFMVWKRPS